MTSFSEHCFLADEVGDMAKANAEHLSDIYAFCRQLNECAQTRLLKIKVQNDDPQQHLLVTLYMHLLSNFQGAVLGTAHVESRCGAVALGTGNSCLPAAFASVPVSHSVP